VRRSRRPGGVACVGQRGLLQQVSGRWIKVRLCREEEPQGEEVELTITERERDKATRQHR
jgi:hypothetical protein